MSSIRRTFHLHLPCQHSPRLLYQQSLLLPWQGHISLGVCPIGQEETHLLHMYIKSAWCDIIMGLHVKQLILHFEAEISGVAQILPHSLLQIRFLDCLNECGYNPQMSSRYVTCIVSTCLQWCCQLCPCHEKRTSLRTWHSAFSVWSYAAAWRRRTRSMSEWTKGWYTTGASYELTADLGLFILPPPPPIVYQ